MNVPSTYSLVLYVHVLAGAFLLGGSMLAPLTRRAIRRATNAGTLRPWLGFAHASTRANPLAALVLLGTGVYLGSSGVWSSAWFAVACVLWLVNSVLAAGAVDHTLKRMGEGVAALLSDHPVPADVERLRWSARFQYGLDVILANDLTALFLMLVRPSLGLAIAAVIGAHALSLTVRAVAGALATRRAPEPRPARA